MTVGAGLVPARRSPNRAGRDQPCPYSFDIGHTHLQTAIKDEFKTEIAVVTIDSLQGEESFDYSMRMARSWGIGSKDNDIRGLLILIAVKDGKTAFRTSRHIEGELTDSVTGEISRGMNASFKRGDFGGGLSAGMDMILDRLNGVYEPQTGAGQTTNHVLPWWLPITLAFISITSLGLFSLSYAT